MPEVHIDLQKGFVVTETAGIAVELHRGFVAHGFNDPNISGTIITDPEQVWGLLLDAGIPDAGDEFDFGGYTAILVDRDITIDEHSTASGTLVYRYYPPEYRSSTGLQQISTPFDRQGEQVTVSHNGSDPQTGELRVRIPRLVLSFEFAKELFISPLEFTKSYLGSVNSDLWGGGAENTWLITSMNYDLMARKATSAWWHFTLEFEYNVDGHQIDIYYRDHEDGKPAPGLVDGEGKKTIDYYSKVPFAAIFPQP